MEISRDGAGAGDLRGEVMGGAGMSLRFGFMAGEAGVVSGVAVAGRRLAFAAGQSGAARGLGRGGQRQQQRKRQTNSTDVSVGTLPHSGSLAHAETRTGGIAEFGLPGLACVMHTCTGRLRW